MKIPKYKKFWGRNKKLLIGIPLIMGFLFFGISSFLVTGMVPQSFLEIGIDTNWIKLSGETISWNRKNQYIIVYSGFIGCSKRCPIALDKMNRLGERLPKDQFRFYFFNTDSLAQKKDIVSFLKLFPNVDIYYSTHKNPSDQLRKLKFRTGIRNPEEHSDHFLVFPPGEESPFISKDLGFLKTE